MALNRWEAAASIYVEIGEMYPNSHISFNHAGSCYLFAGMYNLALEMYLKGLSGQQQLNSNINEPPYKDVVERIFFLHLAIFEATLATHDQNNHFIDAANNKQVGCTMVFLAFKELVKMDAEKFFGMPTAFCQAILKDKFRKPKHANRALLKALNSKSFNEYTTILQGLARSGVPVPFVPTFSTEMSDGIRQILTERKKKLAWTVVKNKASSIDLCAYCGNWECADDVNNRCPCGKFTTVTSIVKMQIGANTNKPVHDVERTKQVAKR